MLRTLLILVVVLVGTWVVFVAFVAIARPDQTTIRDALRLLPDAVRLVRRVAADHTIPRRTRWLLWFLLVYLVSPIDLIPDFIPVIGYADDVVVAGFVLRLVVRRAGSEKLREHWPGTPEGLAALQRLLRLPTTTATSTTEFGDLPPENDG
jgi:uncharacterized membrane protein YkvA (DUF1232 family)